MNHQNQEKSDWQVALDHHEELCAERGRALTAQFKAIDMRFEGLEKRMDNIEKLQLFTLGAILVWPSFLLAAFKLLA